MKQVRLTILKQEEAAGGVYRMELGGDISAVERAGQFVNLNLPGFFLRRPISVCDAVKEADGRGVLTLLYKEAGAGTRLMAKLGPGTVLDVLTGLGNGFDISAAGKAPVLIGGGIGAAPLLWLLKELRGSGLKARAVLGFNTAGEMLLRDDFLKYIEPEDLAITTLDGSYGIKGLVTDALKEGEYSYFYACGPSPMLRAVYKKLEGPGEFSLEERMGCGFGACVGCSAKTHDGIKRVCKDGPVFKKEVLKWED